MKGVALALSVSIMVLAPLTAAKALQLSREQQRRLEGGEVVVVDELPPGGVVRGSQGGTGLSLVHASPEAVRHVLVNYEHHSGLYPRVVRAQVLQSDADHALVRYVIGVGPFSFGFYVDNYLDEGRPRIVWRLARERRNNLFRDVWGYWQIDPRPTGVLLTYSMAARTVLPAFLTRGGKRDGLVETLRAVRDRAERRRQTLSDAPSQPWSLSPLFRTPTLVGASRGRSRPTDACSLILRPGERMFTMPS